VRLSFAPGEAAQVDFGAGPFLTDPNGTVRRTWAFVMTLCFSRHQYLEFVFDQSVPTWLGCNRRAFEWFASVPARIPTHDARRGGVDFIPCLGTNSRARRHTRA
jgi:transposase